MLTFLLVVFWGSLFLLVYPYVIYPVLLKLFDAVFGENHNLKTLDDDWPSVSFMISAFNEAEHIAEKLQNALELDYPADSLDIYVISDASDDGTDDIVREWATRHPRIHLVRQNVRRGKAAGLNVAMGQVRSDLVVFSDANAMFQPDAIKELVKYFANPEVGYVIGSALYYADDGNQAAGNEGVYWKFELFLKQVESRFYSVVGGDGAIYGIRRNLFWELADDDINDFVNPLQIVAHGYRGIYNPDAICWEDAAGDFEKEFRRKRRIVNRSWRATRRYLHLFSPGRHAKFLFELFSHKVIRWFGFVFLSLAFLSNLGLLAAGASPFYALTMAGQVLMGVLSLIALNLQRRERPIPTLVNLPYYFFLANYGAILGIIDAFRGETYTTWNHVRISENVEEGQPSERRPSP